MHIELGGDEMKYTTKIVIIILFFLLFVTSISCGNTLEDIKMYDNDLDYVNAFRYISVIKINNKKNVLAVKEGNSKVNVYVDVFDIDVVLNIKGIVSETSDFVCYKDSHIADFNAHIEEGKVYLVFANERPNTFKSLKEEDLVARRSDGIIPLENYDVNEDYYLQDANNYRIINRFKRIVEEDVNFTNIADYIPNGEKITIQVKPISLEDIRTIEAIDCTFLTYNFEMISNISGDETVAGYLRLIGVDLFNKKNDEAIDPLEIGSVYEINCYKSDEPIYLGIKAYMVLSKDDIKKIN